MPDQLVQGPRSKNEATQDLEKLVQRILQARADKQPIEVYNAAGETMIQINSEALYNLTTILKKSLIGNNFNLMSMT